MRTVPYSIGLSSGLVAAVVMLQRWLQKPRAGTEFLLVWSGWGLCAALAIWIALRCVPREVRKDWTPAGVDGDSWKAYLLAIQAGMLALCIPAYFYVWRTPWEEIDWGGDFLNKRWLLALYWLAIATFLVLPHLMRRIVDRSVTVAAPIQSRAGKPLAKLALAGILAWWVAGPPWHLERLHREIDGHEQVNLGPLQAVDKGYLPYVGPASSQYGPGSQLLTYGIMKWTGHFDLLSYREAGAWFHLLTVFGIFAAAAVFLDDWMFAPAVLLAMAYSPIRFFDFLPSGALEGFYGWANGFRYMGAMIFVAGLPAAMRRGGMAPVGLGAALGLFCYVSQENLSTAMAGGGLLLALLWLTGTEGARTVGRCAGLAACGFAAVWTPVLLFYAARGAAGAFLRGYLLFGSSVAHGVLNSWWLSAADSPDYRPYLFTGALLVAVGVCTLCDVRSWRLRFGLDRRQTRLLAFVCAAAAAYTVSLFRSDAWHTLNTTIALPFVLLLTIWDLPGWTAPAGWRRWALRGGVACVVLWVYPLVGAFATDGYEALVRGPVGRFTARAAAVAAPADPRIPFQRATRYWCDEPEVCEDSIAVRPFLEKLSELRELVGTRKTMVAGFPSVFPALVGFLADLTPAPHFLPREMIMPDMRRESVEFLRAHVAEYECLVTDDLGDPETLVFRAAYPGARVVSGDINGEQYYILLRP